MTQTASSSVRRVIVGGAIAAIAGMALWDLLGVRENLTADVAATAHVEPWTGAYSTFGLIVWGIMIGALLLAAVVMRRRGDRQAFWFFAVTTSLAGYLAVDDAFLLHEDVLPDDIGFPESAFYLALLIGAATWLVAYRRFSGRIRPTTDRCRRDGLRVVDRR